MSRRTRISIGLVALTVVVAVLVLAAWPQREHAAAPTVDSDRSSAPLAMKWRAWRARWLPTAPGAPMPAPIPAQRPEWSQPHASMPSKPPPFPAQPPLRIEISADALPRPPRKL